MKNKKTIVAALAACLTLTLPLSGINPKRDILGVKADQETKEKSKSLLVKGSGSDQPRQVVKLNLSQLTLKTLAFQYEYGFHKNFSGALGVNFFLPRPLPGLFSSDDPSGEGLRDARTKGFSVTPEIRFYPGKKEEHLAPHGFYLAAYMRFAKYSLTSNYYENYNNQRYGYDFKMTYGGYTVGAMLGYQWLIGEHFSIDFWMLGGGAGKAKLTMQAVAQGVDMTQAQQDDVKASLTADFEAAKYLGATPSIETTPNSVKATLKGVPMLSYRGLGVCLGFAF